MKIAVLDGGMQREYKGRVHRQNAVSGDFVDIAYSTLTGGF
jgi:hypothetical protein